MSFHVEHYMVMITVYDFWHEMQFQEFFHKTVSGSDYSRGLSHTPALAGGARGDHTLATGASAVGDL
jgi:hypothetical protein